MKVREGNDVRGLRITIPNESTLSFNSVSNLKVVAQRATDKSSTIVADKVFIENDKTIDIYFRAVKARGKHHVLVSFSIPDAVLTGVQNVIKDFKDAFEIVEFSAQEDTEGATYTLDHHYGLDGLSYYQIWSQYYTGTEEDMIAWHRQPAVDAAASVTQLGILIASAESAREAAEGLRVTAEQARATAEGLRVTAEESRATAEGLRVTAEQSRVTAENNRVTAGAVLKTGNETIAGVKTFSSSPIVPTPISSNQAANKGYVDSLMETWVGVIVDPNLSSSEPSPKSTVVAYRATELRRTGNLNYHKFGNSRIFNSFYPCIVTRATKVENWRLDKNNPALKEDGTPSNPDWTTQNGVIFIPNIWRRIRIIDGKEHKEYDIEPFAGATLWHKASYHSIGDAQLDRTNNHLVSVISDDVRFRGGGNQSAWDAQHRSQLGMPLTDTSRPNFELYANNAGWQTMNIYDWTMFSELAMLYFANTNIQLDYTSVLTPEGYPQGGLGAGNTSWISKRWDGFCGYYPIDKVGEGFSSVGCNVGIKSKTINDYYKGLTTAVAANKLVATAHFAASAGWLSSYVGYTVRNMTTGLTATILAKDSDDQLSLSADIFTATNQIFSIDGINITYNIPVFFGLENLYGHLWKHCSGINFMVQAADAGGRSMAYVNPDWATRSASEVTNYQYVGDTPRVDGYIKELHTGWNITKVNAGAASNTFWADYAYHSNLPGTGSVIRCLLVSGHALNGAAAGLRYAAAYYTPSIAAANIGARLRAEKG